MYYDIPEEPGIARAQATGYPADDAEIPGEDPPYFIWEAEDI